MRHQVGRHVFLAAVVASFICVPVLEGSDQTAGVNESRAPQLRPAAGSPLAAIEPPTGGTLRGTVFAVAEDRERVIAQPSNLSTPWQVLSVAGTFQDIGGLAVSGTSLFVTDRGDESVSRVDLTTRERRLLFEDGPLDDPGSIAIARDVFIADDANGRLFRVRGTEVREVMLDIPVAQRGRLTLTAAGDDLLVSTSTGLIVELRGIGRTPLERVPTQTSQVAPKGSPSGPNTSGSGLLNVGSQLTYEVQKRAFPEIREPSGIALWKGIVYVVDGTHQGLFAFARGDHRPVRLVRSAGNQQVGPASVAVTDSALFVLKGTTLERWPRLIPAEVHLRLASLSEAMTLVYGYLGERGILPTRQVSIDQNIEATLKKERVILGAYPQSLTPLLCRLNRDLCDATGAIRAVQARRLMWVPDLYSENYVDAVPVRLDGKETLGAVADRRVQSEEFRGWTSKERLAELNEAAVIKSQVASARDLRTGELMVPVEYVRYLVPAVAGDASGEGPLKKLERVFEGLKVVSLEERLASAAATGEQTSTLAVLKTQFEAMLRLIDYTTPAVSLVPPKIGVAEKFIDRDHPDLKNALIQPEGVLEATPAAVGVSGAVNYRIRSFESADHGTMVAGLIGARGTGFQHPGLAPKALMLSIDRDHPQVGEDIRKAVLRGVTVFNISAHYQIGISPASVQQAIEKYPRALFVVAAGNDTKLGSTDAVCGTFSVYPACWHDKKNVLVVTATNAAGDAVLAPTANEAGANWSGLAVHVAAPGEGFHASAVGQSYAPVNGSSFATPLVTATAALIYAQGFTDPWLIKQRLIATADPQTGLSGKVLGGRLNVRRAVSDPGYGVLTRPRRVDANTTTTETLRVITDRGNIVVRQADGEERTLPIRRVLRVHKYGNGYRVVFVDGDRVQVLEGAAFETERRAQFSATDANGAALDVSLVDWSDYVAPIAVPAS